MRSVLCRLPIIASLVLITACMPIPDIRIELSLPTADYRVLPEQVVTEYVSLDGYQEKHTPDELNRALYQRYYHEEDEADTILVLMPGLYGGAMSFDILARQLVAATRNLEVWAIDRRSSLLEDRHASRLSLESGDPKIAYEYYVENKGTQAGFQPLAAAEVRYMAHWGLEVHLRDLHEIVRRARERASIVVLGGHSLGASMAAFYLAFDFGGGSAEPGHLFVDGLMLIDGTPGRTGAFEMERIGIGPLALVPTKQDLIDGRGKPYLTVTRGPDFFAKAEAAALLARFAPDELSPGGFVDFPATNRAVVGMLGDDHYALTPVFAASLGEAVGARYSGNLTAVILSGSLGLSSRSVSGVADSHEYVDWRRGDPKREVTDLDAFARSWVGLESGFGEWYFPVRLLLDVAELPLHNGLRPGFMPHDQVRVPTLAVGVGRGLITSLDGFSAYMNVRPGTPFASYILPGMTHIDIVTAEQNPLVPLFQAWHSHFR